MSSIFVSDADGEDFVINRENFVPQPQNIALPVRVRITKGEHAGLIGDCWNLDRPALYRYEWDEHGLETSHELDDPIVEVVLSVEDYHRVYAYVGLSAVETV